jgi:threonine aldolase
MDFRSDNMAACVPEIMAAVAAANTGAAAAYGADDWSKRLDEAFSALFERQVWVFPVATGTAANAIALASAAPPWGGIICHREAHIECDECGAPEFYSGGAKLITIDGVDAKIDAGAVRDALARYTRAPHAVKPAAISISQTSERGAVYTARELTSLGACAREAGLAFHVDGARFANAAAASNCSPAALSWRAGVDLLSFGATKNGAIGAEAIVAFNEGFAAEIIRRRKRGGHLLSKQRFAAAQLLAFIEDGLWLRLAARANALAAKLGVAARAHLSAPVESNLVFIKPGLAALARLRQAGVQFYDWGAEGSGEARLAVSWNQNEGEVDALATVLASL